MDKVHLIEEHEDQDQLLFAGYFVPRGCASCGAGCSAVVLGPFFREFDRLTCKPDYF